MFGQAAQRYEITLASQGLNNCSNERTVLFFQGLLQHSLRHWQGSQALAVKVLSQFSAIYLIDSSYIQLKAPLAPLFRGA
jgi:hypothetical protein